MSSTDVESLQPTVRDRNKCVYASLACLAIAVVVTSLGGAAVFIVVWRELQTQKELLNKHVAQQMESNHQSSAQSASLPEVGIFKSRHVAYLRATSATIGEQMMEWEGIDIGNSSSIGTNYDFNQRQRVLRVKQPGSYFIYLNLSLKSTDVAHSTDGEVKVTLKFSDGQLLTCKVKLTDDSAVQERCFAVVQHLGPDSHINAEMSVHRSADGWKLVSNESGFGMFLVDSP